jgi:hypothetical protein
MVMNSLSGPYRYPSATAVDQRDSVLKLQSVTVKWGLRNIFCHAQPIQLPS